VIIPKKKKIVINLYVCLLFFYQSMLRIVLLTNYGAQQQKCLKSPLPLIKSMKFLTWYSLHFLLKIKKIKFTLKWRTNSKYIDLCFNYANVLNNIGIVWLINIIQGNISCPSTFWSWGTKPVFSCKKKKQSQLFFFIDRKRWGGGGIQESPLMHNLPGKHVGLSC